MLMCSHIISSLETQHAECKHEKEIVATLRNLYYILYTLLPNINTHMNNKYKFIILLLLQQFIILIINLFFLLLQKLFDMMIIIEKEDMKFSAQ